ncbi:VIT1/CCC1 transporter family protein [Cellulomonas sp. zg-ZUI222]|uniref:VIT1/CCC1 transporter family protein n=1 Tax=Cellulomonas wangleii TaxID=2816956 RepID=A0ABX8D3R8_9CELL|nr:MULTISPECIES: VIT1/CCC1 family protein [Cellulomonas]MBO0899004.1 VIT1/CCC1 transporter family protein [Cellulomonas sp. zg-ZUI22]MBO0919856.1 VIT1/CCC1 transporter family protein [Cellulomonas wangleii]MBO0923713.1 VIT1/CCC1 transporter family protein [Cellulomonas wangleii]MBO0923995.1 VIT1/CCC1 transporter family protein [Cellulomonas wangleii]QVI62024.1 VIT1/CCC1 transporter family protein [Cellulomonas wangleii]
MSTPAPPGETRPTPAQLRRWRRNLADERAEAAVYRDLASRRTGEEREILLALAEAERRHEAHWLDLLGDDVGRPVRGDWRTRVLSVLARRFGSVWVYALAQRAEARSTYGQDSEATARMAADEQIHEEVVRGLAMRGRQQISGTFRAAVFGANDGLVSNLALVLGIGASGVATGTVLLTGLAGLLAGALSMAAGEYVSVRSQRELLEASRPAAGAASALAHLDVDANELALVYRARGMSAADAQARADVVLASLAQYDAQQAVDASLLRTTTSLPSGDRAAEAGDALAAAPAAAPRPAAPERDEHESVGTAWGAAMASFCFFASGALIPVVPYLLGASGTTAVLWSAGLVGVALLGTGSVVGLLSGASPVRRALRQLAIGYGAAAVTYALGLLFGTSAV